MTLFNCCRDGVAPDWWQFVALEVVPVEEVDGACEPVCGEPWRATFWSVYGRNADGEYLALTDVSTEKLAIAVADIFRSLAAAAGVELK